MTSRAADGRAAAPEAAARGLAEQIARIERYRQLTEQVGASREAMREFLTQGQDERIAVDSSLGGLVHLAGPEVA